VKATQILSGVYPPVQAVQHVHVHEKHSRALVLFGFGRLSDIDLGGSAHATILALYHCPLRSYYPFLIPHRLLFAARFSSTTRDMATLSEPSFFESLFQSALEDYQKQTGIDLVRHPLTIQLERCNTVESITEVLQGQARAFHDFRGDDNKIMTLLKQAAQIFHKLSATVVLGEAVGLVCRNGR
jgi:hypothetical protein